MLVRLIYHSENRLRDGRGRIIPQLNDILDSSNRNNQQSDITGALLFDRKWFVQLLEGERDLVNETYRRILGDPRHGNVTLIETRNIASRLFGNWWMGASLAHGGHSDIFARYGMTGGLDPSRLSGDKALGLALDLSGYGLQRKLNPAIYRSFALARAMTAAPA